MNWSVEFTNKARKQKDKLPVRVRELLFQLVRDIQATGPVRGDWPNYSKLSNNIAVEGSPPQRPAGKALCRIC